MAEWRKAREQAREDAAEAKRRGEKQKEEERQKREAEKREKDRQDAIERANEQIGRYLALARNEQASAEDKRKNLAWAVASLRELDRVNGDEAATVSDGRIRDNAQRLSGCTEFVVAEREGRLDELARLSAEEIDRRVREREKQVDAYVNGDEDSARRADSIFRQMDRTWRVRRNSREFEAAKRAMQEVGSLDREPDRRDCYMAAETVKARRRRRPGSFLPPRSPSASSAKPPGRRGTKSRETASSW